VGELNITAHLFRITEIIAHHRGTESTEKVFFHLPGDTGK
jgi:hypothetical protein